MLKHAKELKKQIVEKDEHREQEKAIVGQENQKLQETYQGQRALLEKIKQDKIRELKQLNVPEKYIVELENKKIHWHIYSILYVFNNLACILIYGREILNKDIDYKCSRAIHKLSIGLVENKGSAAIL